MSTVAMYPGMAELEAGLAEIARSPRDAGLLKRIVQRPDVDERRVVDSARLDTSAGLVGDNWRARYKGDIPAGSPYLQTQLTVMNARVAALVAGEPARWGLAGDQLYVDLDLSGENLPPGTQLGVGMAVIEVTAVPHTGCSKFVARFGRDAMLFVNSEKGRALNLRGINAKVVTGGRVSVNELVTVRR